MSKRRGFSLFQPAATPVGNQTAIAPPAPGKDGKPNGATPPKPSPDIDIYQRQLDMQAKARDQQFREWATVQAIAVASTHPSMTVDDVVKLTKFFHNFLCGVPDVPSTAARV